ISQNRQFGKSDDRQDYLAKWNYFEMLHSKLTDEEIMNNLRITRAELKYLTRYIKNTIEFIGKNIAIYGLGKRGQQMIQLYQATSVTIKYVLDKNKKNFDFPQLNLDEELPDVDAIIITPKAEQDELIKWLSKKTNIKLWRYKEWEDTVFSPQRRDNG
ncbi:MAG: hypothetical protein HFH85_07040, partial [Lachnospiraceae bacterium]|nr:hypothetical protein [Lachnospiraceae bacterium]